MRNRRPPKIANRTVRPSSSRLWYSARKHFHATNLYFRQSHSVFLSSSSKAYVFRRFPERTVDGRQPNKTSGVKQKEVTTTSRIASTRGRRESRVSFAPRTSPTVTRRRVSAESAETIEARPSHEWATNPRRRRRFRRFREDVNKTI